MEKIISWNLKLGKLFIVNFSDISRSIGELSLPPNRSAINDDDKYD